MKNFRAKSKVYSETAGLCAMGSKYRQGGTGREQIKLYTNVCWDFSLCVTVYRKMWLVFKMVLLKSAISCLKKLKSFEPWFRTLKYARVCYSNHTRKLLSVVFSWHLCSYETWSLGHLWNINDSLVIQDWMPLGPSASSSVWGILLWQNSFFLSLPFLISTLKYFESHAWDMALGCTVGNTFLTLWGHIQN